MDDEIWQCVREGRRDDAIARLLPAYRERVFALTYSILGQRAEAEDVAQDVFVKIWRALPSFDGRSALSTWIYAIARNAAISALRGRRRQLSLSEEAVQADVEQRAADAADGDDRDGGGAAAAAMDAARLERWVAALPAREQQVVRLYYLRECSVDEVAQMMGMPAGTVKTLLFRGRAKLRQMAGIAGEDS